MNLRYKLNRGDAIGWLRGFKAESVDLIITDPAYESLEEHRKVGTTTRLKKSKSSTNEWFRIFPNARFPLLFEEMYRVMKKNTHLYIMCDQTTMFVIKPMGEAAGFKFWKPIIWDKENIGMGYHYRARHEFVLFFEKGKRKLNSLSTPDVLNVKKIHNGYPTEKPVGLSKILIEQSSEKNQFVIDPFMGSASIGEACLKTDRRYMGNDIEEHAVETSRKRLEGLGE